MTFQEIQVEIAKTLNKAADGTIDPEDAAIQIMELQKSQIELLLDIIENVHSPKTA